MYEKEEVNVDVPGRTFYERIYLFDSLEVYTIKKVPFSAHTLHPCPLPPLAAGVLGQISQQLA